MNTAIFFSSHNTPQLANPRGRHISRVGLDPTRSQVMDLWVHPEKYRSYETNNHHSLDTLA